MKKIFLVFTLFAFIFSSGCDLKRLNQDYFGTEIYNGVFPVSDGIGHPHQIFFFSRKDLSEVQNISIEKQGGDFDSDCSIEACGLRYRGFSLYKITLTCENLIFTNDIIEITKIHLNFKDGQTDELSVARCQYVNYTEKYTEKFYLCFQGTPLTLPDSGFSVEFQTEGKPVKLTDLFFSNDDLRFIYYPYANSLDSEVIFKEFYIDKYYSFPCGFSINGEDLYPYMQYATKIVARYEVGEDKEIVFSPGFTQYNFLFNRSSYEKYYNYLLNNQ